MINNGFRTQYLYWPYFFLTIVVHIENSDGRFAFFLIMKYARATPAYAVVSRYRVMN